MKAEQLWASILQEAIQGKLVPQLESEPEVNQIGEVPENVPFAVPEKWKWVTLGAISKKIHYGYTTSAKEKGNARLLRITDIQNGVVNWSSVPFCSPSDKEISKFKLNVGDIVIARTGGTIGKSFLISGGIKGNTVFASYLIRVIPELGYVNPAYLQNFLKSPCYWEQLIDGSRGTGQPNVNAQALSEIKIPLPPPEEQRRIVNRLIEIQTFIVSYGEEQEALEKLEQKLPSELKASLLQEAIRGKLVPQLVSEPEVKQIGEVPKDIPFAIPEKWSWIRLGELVNYGSSKQIEGFKITASTWVLDLEDVEKNSGKLLQKKYGTKTTSNKSCFKKGDVLYGKLRPYLNKVLIADEDGCCTTEIIPISVSSAKLKLDAEFLCYFLRSPYFIEYANSCAYGVKMPRLGTKDAKAALVPIPPFQEQQRIVRRLKQLFTLITDLE